MNATQRRYDMDWLRVIAIGLLLIYHAAIVFQPWGVFIGFIQSARSLPQVWVPMSMLNVWRIPLLFYVSGMGVAFAMKKRTPMQLLIERSKRILIPLLFGMLIIVPIHILIWQKYYNQDLVYKIGRGHLWFLANIFVYVLLCLPFFYVLQKRIGEKVQAFLQRLFQTPLGMLVVLIPFVLEAYILKPDSFVMYALTWHGFYIGLLAFICGYLFVFSGRVVWENFSRWWGLYFVLGAILFLIRYLVFDLNESSMLMAIESNVWIFAWFGLAYKYLNKSGNVLGYLSSAAYPVYILHMVFLYWASVLFLPLSISPWLTFLMVVVFSFAASFLVYEMLIRRIWVVGILFGVKRK